MRGGLHEIRICYSICDNSLQINDNGYWFCSGALAPDRQMSDWRARPCEYCIRGAQPIHTSV